LQLFERPRPRFSVAAAVVAAVLLHIAAFAGALALRIQYHRPTVQYVPLPPEPEAPPFLGVREGRRSSELPRRSGRTRTPATAPMENPDTTATAAPTAVAVAPTAPARRAQLIGPPGEGDSRLWVNPRPALPAEVADALYGEHPPQDSVVVRRLRAMVDSLNVIIDSEQRANRLPSWVARGSNGKPVWGIDQSGIYVAGVKIPTPVLALLGSLLPPGNYDESVRQRHLADMRADIMQAAQRAENLEQFRRYVRELRARKQAERDAERRQRGDTTSVNP
jgi:hypothetical protein